MRHNNKKRSENLSNKIFLKLH